MHGIVLFSDSWGEVDWILPVLFKIKELEPNIKLSAVFRHRELFSRKNTGLAAQLDKVIDSYIVGALSNLEPSRFILKDYGPDNSFKNKICSEHREARIVVYPHATNIDINRQPNAPDAGIWRTHAPSHDIMLVGTNYDSEWWSRRLPNPNFKIVGFPRYDSWWVKVLTADSNFLSSKEYEVSTKYNIIMYATRGPHLDLSRSAYFPKDVHDYLVRSTAEIILEDPNNFLIVKPHPRQSLDVLQDLLVGYDRWMFTKFQALQIASISNITISMCSSCTFDSLATGTPVIEFFQFSLANEQYVVLKDKSLGSSYTYLGLTLPVDTKEKLRFAFYGDNDKIYEEEMKNFSSLMIEDASKLAALVILEE